MTLPINIRRILTNNRHPHSATDAIAHISASYPHKQQDASLFITRADNEPEDPSTANHFKGSDVKTEAAL